MFSDLEQSLGLLPKLTQGGRLSHPVFKIDRDKPDPITQGARNEYDPVSGTLVFQKEFYYAPDSIGSHNIRIGAATAPADPPQPIAFLERTFGRRRPEKRLFIHDALVNQIPKDAQTNLPMLRKMLLSLGIAEIDYWDYLNDGTVKEKNEKWLPWAEIRPGEHFSVTVTKEGFNHHLRPWDKGYSWRPLHDDIQEKHFNPAYVLPENPQRVTALCKTREAMVAGLWVDERPMVRKEQPEKSGILSLLERTRGFENTMPEGLFLSHASVRFDSAVTEDENGEVNSNPGSLVFANGNLPLPISVPVFRCTEAEIIQVKIEELVHPDDLCFSCYSALSQRAVRDGHDNYVVKRIENVRERVSYDYRFITEPEFILVAEDVNREKALKDLSENSDTAA